VFVLRFLESSGLLDTTERELPRSPGEEGDDDEERDDGVSSETITGAPEEVELDDEEHDDGDRDVETDPVTGISLCIVTHEGSSGSSSGVDTLGGIELTLAVELVEPDDDEGSDTEEEEVDRILESIVLHRSHVGTVHTVDVENTNDGDHNIDEPVVIHKAGNPVRTDTDVNVSLMLSSGENVEYHGKEDETEDEISPEDAAAELVLEERERTALFANCLLLRRGISAAHRAGSGICDHLNCRRC